MKVSMLAKTLMVGNLWQVTKWTNLIAGQYGGGLPETTKQGEQVLIQEIGEHIRTVTFSYNQDKKIKIFESYGSYICGFSHDGNYFLIADDAGIIVLKRDC